MAGHCESHEGFTKWMERMEAKQDETLVLLKGDKDTLGVMARLAIVEAGISLLKWSVGLLVAIATMGAAIAGAFFSWK